MVGAAPRDLQPGETVEIGGWTFTAGESAHPGEVLAVGADGRLTRAVFGPRVTLVDFLLARIAEDEEYAREQQRINGARYALKETWRPSTELGGLLGVDPARVLAECEAKRHVLKLHRAWPTLVKEELQLQRGGTPEAMTMRMTQRIAWLTMQQYRDRFGDDPPTTPILAVMALPYADHRDYRQEWAP